MDQESAIEITAMFRGLMPRMTETQIIEIAEFLQRFPDADRAMDVLQEYARTNEDFNLCRVESMLRNCLRTPAFRDAAGRTAASLAQERAAAAVVESEWNAVAAMIDACTDPELAELKSLALAEMEPQLAELARRGDPRDTRRKLLRSAIANLIRAERLPRPAGVPR